MREKFWHIGAEHIFQIPIFHKDTEDYISWHLTKSGIFSVRSAYYKQWEANYDADNMGMTNFYSAPHPVWKKLWNLKVPAKINFSYGDAYTMPSSVLVF